MDKVPVSNYGTSSALPSGSGCTKRTACDILASDRWQRLANFWPRPQRLLFASTGRQPPLKASDILYITLGIGGAKHGQHDAGVNSSGFWRSRQGVRGAPGETAEIARAF